MLASYAVSEWQLAMCQKWGYLIVKLFDVVAIIGVGCSSVALAVGSQLTTLKTVNSNNETSGVFTLQGVKGSEVNDGQEDEHCALKNIKGIVVFRDIVPSGRAIIKINGRLIALRKTSTPTIFRSSDGVSVTVSYVGKSVKYIGEDAATFGATLIVTKGRMSGRFPVKADCYATAFDQ
jgi:hypothetical protein